MAAVNFDTQALHTVEAIYAKALLDLAVEASRLDGVAQQMAELGELIQRDADLQRLLDSRLLSVEERAGVIDRVFKPHVDELIHRFLQVVNRKGRLAELAAIIDAFAAAVRHQAGIINVDAFVAAALDEASANNVAQRIGSSMGKTVELRQHVDPLLIGGLKIRMGDQVVDGSVSTQLRLLKQKMVDAGREKARMMAKEA